MIHKKHFAQTLTAITLSLGTASVYAQSLHPLDAERGRDVHFYASHCDIGPFQKVSKAGEYNRICQEMSDAEKCLALVKKQLIFNEETYELNPVPERGRERAAYCLSTMMNGLLAEGTSTETEDEE